MIEGNIINLGKADKYWSIDENVDGTVFTTFIH